MSQTVPNPWEIRESAFLVYVNSIADEDLYVEEELEGLCEAAHITPIGSMRQRIDKPWKAAYIGSGKLEELKAYVLDANADVVIFDCELTGIQNRNISDALQRKVVDRTQLILDIFARRARTREGHLQVELAQLSYLLPRLMSVYTKFERQRGGIGMRGPGETKLESDRRMVNDRIAKLKDEIEDVKKHRAQQRAARKKHPYPSASIAGYTSAGKSTLMNLLSGTDVLADAMPFATLDPTTRKLELHGGYCLYLTDTVGFIRNLPTNLVAAFRATLEEVAQSDFILHVIDVSHPQWETQEEAVLHTLGVLDAADKPMLTVYNKIDRVEDKAMLRDLVARTPNSVAISAITHEGMEDLHRHLRQMVEKFLGRVQAVLPYDKASLVEECYRFGRVLNVDYQDDGIHIEAELVEEMRQILSKYVVP